MKLLAIIPARGGSKRIPGKNRRLFLGNPMLTYSVRAATEAGIFDEIICSTDDPEIAELAEAAGARIPFLRSPETSTDAAALEDVFLEVLNEYSKRGQTFQYFCGIMATAPFLTAFRLRDSFEKIAAQKADLLVPVVRFSYPIQRALFQNEKGRLEMFQPQYRDFRSQDLVPAYHDAGQFYWNETTSFLKDFRRNFKDAVPYELPESEVQDIDTEEDWKIAEMKYRLIHGTETAP